MNYECIHHHEKMKENLFALNFKLGPENFKLDYRQHTEKCHFDDIIIGRSNRMFHETNVWWLFPLIPELLRCNGL